MKKYLSIYYHLSNMNFSQLLMYRSNLINSLVSNAIWGTFSILLVVILTSRTSSVFGWTRYEISLLFGIYNVYLGLFYALFARTFERFSPIIDKGELDFVLLKPIDSQFLMSFTFVNHPALLRVAVGLIFTVWIIIQMHLVLSLMTYFLFVILMIAGVAIMYSLWYLFLTCLIWWTNLTNLVGLLYELNNLTRYPQQMYKATSGLLANAILPLTLVITTPALILVNKVNLENIILVLFFAAFFVFLSRVFWKFALKYYTSAGG